MPRVSIGLPVYNGERYLRQALDSLFSQSFEDFEVVICDNASTDDTREICQHYVERDDRFKYFRQPENLGAARNYNDAFSRARGPYFKWMAHDDMIAPSFLERCLQEFNNDSGSIVLVFPRMRLIDEDNAPLGDYDDPIPWDGDSAATRLDSLLAHPQHSYIHKCFPVFGLFRSDALRKTRLIGRFNGSDKVTLVETALLGAFAEVPEFLFFKRIHSERSIVAHSNKKDMARWFDPKGRHLIVAPRTRLFVEYMKSVLRTALPFHEKRACVRVVLSLLRREWRILGGEIKRAVRDAINTSQSKEGPR